MGLTHPFLVITLRKVNKHFWRRCREITNLGGDVKKCQQGTTVASQLFKWLWKSHMLNKEKFFFWLLLRDKLNTRGLLRRKRMHLCSYDYAVCVGHLEESIIHLFFDYPFSQACWIFLDIHYKSSLPLLNMVIAACEQFGSVFFREVIVLACWTICCNHNRIIVENEVISISRCKAFFS